MIDISQKINELRARKKISQRELAEKIGMSFRGLQAALEKNDMKVSTLEKIAKALDVPVSYFFGESVPEVKAGSDLRTQLEICLEKLKAKEEVIKAKDEIIALLKDQLNRKS